jgi:hypothetical protein
MSTLIARSFIRPSVSLTLEGPVDIRVHKEIGTARGVYQMVIDSQPEFGGVCSVGLFLDAEAARLLRDACDEVLALAAAAGTPESTR